MIWVKVIGWGMFCVLDVHLEANSGKLDVKAALRGEENQMPS